MRERKDPLALGTSKWPDKHLLMHARTHTHTLSALKHRLMPQLTPCLRCMNTHCISLEVRQKSKDLPRKVKGIQYLEAAEVEGGEDETRDQRSEGWRKEKYSRGIERVTPNQMKRDGEAEIGEGRADKVGAVWEEWCEITGEERSREQRGGSVRNEQVWEEWESHEQQV